MKGDEVKTITISPHVYAVTSYLFFATLSSCVKSLHGLVAIPLILCIRFTVSFIILLLVTGSHGGLKKTMHTENAKFHIFRAAINVIATGCIFYVLPHVPLAEVNMLGQTYPFILMLLATYVLKEPVKAKQYLSCALGFVGVLLIVRPSGDISPMFGLLVLAAATLNAMGDLLVRWLTRKDSELTITLWFFFLSSIFSGLWCLFEIDQINLTWVQWETLICAGILGGAGQYFLAKSYKRLKVGTMAVYSYLTLCLSVIFGWMIFHEIPTLWMVAGGLFIMAGVQWNYLASRSR